LLNLQLPPTFRQQAVLLDMVLLDPIKGSARTAS